MTDSSKIKKIFSAPSAFSAVKFLSFCVRFCGTLLAGAAFFGAAPAFAGSCCGGSSGVALVIPKYAKELVDVSFDIERYDGFWNANGRYRPDPSGSDLMQYRLNAGFAQRLGQSWQASVTIPYVWNSNKYSGLVSRTSGLGDATLSVWYEALDDLSTWRIRKVKDLTPSVLAGLSLLVPTGISPHDDVISSFDVTGRGFYRLDGNLVVSKMLHPWSASLSMIYGAYFSREVNREYGAYVEPYRKRLGDRFTISPSVGYIYYIGTGGDTLTGTVSFSHMEEGDASINGRREPESGFRKNSVGGAMLYSSTDHDWSIRASWNHSIKADGWGKNFPATDIYTLGVSYAIR